ncbi:MAG TPA: hypothetical protein VJX48_02935 [Xanthobacteraceae bacterium]|nr:hypothetical protein [Xanthobacteraceae bacterium]
MSVPDKVSFFSRFTMKLVEIAAASIATAVGGYLVAHLGGYLPWSAPAPAAIQATPGVSVVSKGPRAQPAPPIAAAADEHRPAPAPGVNPAAIQPARTTAKATLAAPPREPMTTDTSAAESKPGGMESVETQVRAALENVDANRPAPSEVPLQKADTPPERPERPEPPEPPAVGAQPRPVEGALLGTGVVAAVPPAADVAPQPVQQAPVQPEPLPAVEIKSRPVADVATLPQPEPAAPAQEDAKENAKAEDKSLLSTLKKIPEMLRSASGATSNDPPRPPLPVGQ